MNLVRDFEVQTFAEQCEMSVVVAIATANSECWRISDRVFRGPFLRSSRYLCISEVKTVGAIGPNQPIHDGPDTYVAA